MAITQCDLKRIALGFFVGKPPVMVKALLWKTEHPRIYIRLVPVFCLLLLFRLPAGAQDDSVIPLVDTPVLQRVIVTAFSSATRWRDVPASIAVLDKKGLQRYDMTSLVPALNTVAGVRMEERSPGSYRLSIRGSLLRSPFGVRNVKIYWDDIPFTDATGNTYLQLVDMRMVRSVEIIKGPAASYYGANTGGAVILHPDDVAATHKNEYSAALSGGSFGMFSELTAWKHTGKNFVSNLEQGHLQNDGYREQSAMRRDMVQWTAKWQPSSRETLSLLSFYSDLHYETPGGISLQQMDSLPTLARQPSGTIPGAVEQHAGVFNRTAFSAITLSSGFSKSFTNTTSLVLSHTDFRNPFITNYEKRGEWNYGGRTRFAFTTHNAPVHMQVNAGIEWQYNEAYIQVFDNNKGVPAAVQYKDRVHTTEYFPFAQVQATLHDRWSLQAGLSVNTLRYWYDRLTDTAGDYPFIKTEGATASPRFALAYGLHGETNLYASVSKGFSPPTLAEVRPSTGIIERGLAPEYGWNYEAGIKGTTLSHRLDYNVSMYYFRLRNAIVSRTDNTGADYYVNAGGTVQKGLEAWFSARVIQHPGKFLEGMEIWNSFAWQPYRFDQYVSGSADYSGNKMTGVSRMVNVSGLDARIRNSWSLSVTLNCTSSIPLNDANTVTAKPYQLLQARVDKQLTFTRCHLDFFTGADNLLNQRYSLGSDINAFGGRYYNPAPTRNFYLGAQLTY